MRLESSFYRIIFKSKQSLSSNHRQSQPALKSHTRAFTINNTEIEKRDRERQIVMKRQRDRLDGLSVGGSMH